MKNILFTVSVLGVALAPWSSTAAPIEYVRVCDAFGSGYIYIPGSDVCQNVRTGQTRVVTPDGVETGVTPQQQQVLDGTALALQANDTANRALEEALQARAAADAAQMQANIATEGVAVNLAMPTAQVTQGHTFGAALNIGTFGGQTAVGVAGAVRANDNLTFNGSVGMGVQYGTVGASGGMNLSW